MNQNVIKIGVRIIMGVLIVAVLSFVLLRYTRQTQALSVLELPGGEAPFGGIRLFTLKCNCSDNELIYTSDFLKLQTLPLIYQPGTSFPWPFFNPFATYFLGSYIPGAGQCRVHAGLYCRTIPSAGMLGSNPGTAATPY